MEDLSKFPEIAKCMVETVLNGFDQLIKPILAVSGFIKIFHFIPFPMSFPTLINLIGNLKCVLYFKFGFQPSYFLTIAIKFHSALLVQST